MERPEWMKNVAVLPSDATITDKPQPARAG